MCPSAIPAAKEGEQVVVGIGEIGHPAQHAHGVLTLTGLRQIGAPIVGDDLSIEACRRQICLDGLAHFARIRIVPARNGHDPEIGLETVGIAGVSQQFPGPSGVVAVVLEVIVISPEAGRHEVLGRDTSARIERRYDSFFVDGVGNSLTYPEVFEGLHTIFVDPILIQTHVADIDSRHFVDRGVGISLGDRDDIYGYVVDEVHRARLQFQQPGSRLHDDSIDQIVDSWHCAPVVRVGLQGDVVVGDPVHELIGTGAYGMVHVVLAPFLHGRWAVDG